MRAEQRGLFLRQHCDGSKAREHGVHPPARGVGKGHGLGPALQGLEK